MSVYSTDINKEVKYRQLVVERKECNDCEKGGMVNPSKLLYDCHEINAWSQWQGSLSAKIMLVGQDWGDREYFKNSKGLDAGRRKNLEGQGPTNKTLKLLFKETFDYELDIPQKAYGKHYSDLFFTNVVLCLKPPKKGRGMSSPLPKGCAERCAEKFLKRLIEIVQPQVVIALGQMAFESIARSYGLDLEDYSLKKNVSQSFALDKNGNVALFPVYHCSPEGRLSRNPEEQLSDWKRIREYLNGTEMRMR
jgi:DNA polymerase